MKKIYSAPEIELISFVGSEKLATNEEEIDEIGGSVGTGDIPEDWD